MTRSSQASPRSRRRLAWLLCAAVVLAALLGGAWLLRSTHPSPAVTPSRTPFGATLVPTFTATSPATPAASVPDPTATQEAQATAASDASPQSPGLTPTVEAPPVDFTWTISDTRHYSFHYAPGTAAGRDLPQIGALAEAAFQRTRQVLGTEFDGRMKIYFVPRVFWQGAATYGDKVQLISYLDRNYTEVEMWSYFTHEGTHALAQDLILPKEEGGPDGVLVEGLAVWASGGHYGVEPIDAWAAVTAASESYIPLGSLRAGPFYDFQHEISYLQAGSFVKYLVERYGLDKLKDLYGEATGQAEQDEALVARLYGKGYDALEADWLAYLESLSPTAEEARKWNLVVRSFDLMRRYETVMDPDARILPNQSPTDWTSDTLKIFLHQEQAPANVVLETALIAAQTHLRNGDLDRATSLLEDVEASLDAGGPLVRPSLEARLQILDLVESQDRAVLRADMEAYLETWDRTHEPSSGLVGMLQLPFTAYWQEVVRLDVAADGQSAQGVIATHAEVDGSEYAEDGRLVAVTFVLQGGEWSMASREPMEPSLSFPPP